MLNIKEKNHKGTLITLGKKELTTSLEAIDTITPPLANTSERVL